MYNVQFSYRPNVPFGQTVRPNFYCAVQPNDRTFFCRTQNFHIFVLLNDPNVRGIIIGLYVNSQKNANRAKIGIKLSYKLKIVRLLDLGFTPN